MIHYIQNKYLKIGNGYLYLCGSIFILFILYPSSLYASDNIFIDDHSKPVEKWKDDPFNSKKKSWLSLGGYEKKQIADVIAKERQKEIDKRVKAMSAPLMPSMKVPDVEDVEAIVFSTEEDKKWTNIDSIENEIELEKKAKNLKLHFDSGNFKIRFVTLPDPKIKSIYAKKSIKLKKKVVSIKKKKEVDKEKNKEACEAISSYRKRQLKAMESDRKTLSALHNALIELGLTKKLNFMSEKKSTKVTVGSLHE